MFNARKFLTIVLFISAGILIGYVIGLIATKQAHNNEYATSSLFTLSYAIDGLLKQADNDFPNHDARESLEIIAMNQIILAAILKPNLNHLTGRPTEALCLAIYYDETYGLRGGNDKQLPKLVSNYLSSIKSDIIEKTKDGPAISKCPLVKY